MVLTRSQRRWPRTLLGIPPELRLQIIETVLSADIEQQIIKPQLVQRQNPKAARSKGAAKSKDQKSAAAEPPRSDGLLVLGPVHSLLRTCRQLRQEAEPVFFSSRQVSTKDLGELHRAMEGSPSFLKYCTNLQIHDLWAGRTGNKISIDSADIENFWHELQLDLRGMLAKMPKLHCLRIDMLSWRPTTYEEQVTIDKARETICGALAAHPSLRKLFLRSTVMMENRPDGVIMESCELDGGEWRLRKQIRRAAYRREAWVPGDEQWFEGFGRLSWKRKPI